METNTRDFWNLLEPEHGRAEAFCRRLAGNRDDGDDLYQDALVRAIRKFDTLKDTSRFRPWLYRILTNTYRNRCRGPWWRLRVPLTGQEIDARAHADPARIHAARRWLDRGLAALRPDDRVLVTLHEIDGWTIAALAEMQGRPQGTIKARLCRARGRMRKAIERHLTETENESITHGAAYAMGQTEQSCD